MSNRGPENGQSLYQNQRRFPSATWLQSLACIKEAFNREKQGPSFSSVVEHLTGKVLGIWFESNCVLCPYFSVSPYLFVLFKRCWPLCSLLFLLLFSSCLTWHSLSLLCLSIFLINILLLFLSAQPIFSIVLDHKVTWDYSPVFCTFRQCEILEQPL